jgi:Kef-type K+ transport system membrane component KefB
MDNSMMGLHLLLPLVIVPAIILGQFLRRFGLPAVVGQILAGVLLGPMVFGLVEPGESHDANGNANGNGLYELAEIGLCVLLFKIGLETRFGDFARVWRRALGVALAGMALPLGLGIGTGLLLQWPLPAALFLGAALTATSVAVTASVIEEMGVQDSSEARIIMGAAVVDDVLGLLLLSAITVLSTQSESLGLALGRSLIQAVVFLGVAIVVGPFIVRVFDWFTSWLRSEAVLVVLAFSYLLVMAHLAEKIGLVGIIGSYAAGLVFSKQDEESLKRAFEPLTEILTPLFFVLIGSSISFNSDFGIGSIGTVVLVVGVALAGKLLAPWLVPHFGLRRGMVGSGLVPRGEVGLVFAQVGLASLAMTQSQYSILTLVLVVTTLVGPVLFRWEAGRSKSN